jgi:hypothetical protein
MNSKITRVSAALLTLVLGGCASTEGKFTEHKVADLSAFSDNTAVIMQVPAGALTSADAILSETYLLQFPEDIAHLDELRFKGESLFSHIRTYSTRVSDLSVSNLTEEARIAAVAEALKVFSDDIGRADASIQASFEGWLNRVASQEEFLDAVRAAQPIVSSLGRLGQSYLNTFDTTILKLGGSMSVALDKDFEPVHAYFGRVDSRIRILAGRLIDLYARESSLGALADVVEVIIQGLERNHRLAKEARPEWELYVKTANEIDLLQEASLVNTGRARIALLMWVSAHEKMASGQVKEAEWFSMKDVTTAAFMAGRRLL